MHEAGGARASLMKKGLKLHDHHVLSETVGARAFPDEEGIETGIET